MLIFLLRQLKLIVWKLRNRWLFGSLALNEGDGWEPAWCKEVCIALDCWPNYGSISRNHSAGKKSHWFVSQPEAQVLIFAQLPEPRAVYLHSLLSPQGYSNTLCALHTCTVHDCLSSYIYLALHFRVLNCSISTGWNQPCLFSTAKISRPGPCSVRIWAWQRTHCSLSVQCDNRIGSPMWEGNFSATVE